MSRYKVGERVKAREDLVEFERYGGKTFVNDMVELKEKEVTIKSVYDYSEKYRIEELGFTWTNEMFEGLVKPKYKIGDKVELISIDSYDEEYKLKIGDKGIISKLGDDRYCEVTFANISNRAIYYKQIKLAEHDTIEEPSQSIPNKGTIKYRITDDGITYTTLNGHNTGKSIKSSKDESDDKIGILIATARMLGFDEDKISGIVDVLFDDDSSYNSKTKCDNVIMKNDIARALSILDKYNEAE